jgi:hypothetical protein
MPIYESSIDGHLPIDWHGEPNTLLCPKDGRPEDKRSILVVNRLHQQQRDNYDNPHE